MKAKTSKWTVMFASVLTILTAHFGLCTTLGTLDPELEAAIGTYNKSQFREALASFSALAQKKRNEPRIQYYLGLCYFQLGDKVQARRFLEWIFDSPADSWTKTQAALALNRLNGIKEMNSNCSIPWSELEPHLRDTIER